MRQIYMGSDHQVEVGSFPTQGALDSDHTGSVLGFRLTWDNVGRVLRGGCWPGVGPQLARVADRSYDVPSSRFDDLGIRLCADWSEE